MGKPWLVGQRYRSDNSTVGKSWLIIEVCIRTQRRFQGDIKACHVQFFLLLQLFEIMLRKPCQSFHYLVDDEVSQHPGILTYLIFRPSHANRTEEQSDEQSGLC